MIDLHALTCSEHLLLILKYIYLFHKKTSYFNEEGKAFSFSKGSLVLGY